MPTDSPTSIPSSTPTPLPAEPSRGGDGLLAVMAGATIVGTAAIAGFCASASWWLLPIVLVSILVMAAGVALTLTRLLDDGELPAPRVPARTPRAEPSAASGERAVRAPRPVLGR